ncbi:MAG: hypothetical protein ACLTCB_03540 [Merdibacter sp.]
MKWAASARGSSVGRALRQPATGRHVLGEPAADLLDQQQFSVRLLNVDLLRFDGILGWDLLRTMDFELDTIAGQMKVQKNRFRLDRPNLIPCSFPTLLLRETDGSVSLFGIDTGARQDGLAKGNPAPRAASTEQHARGRVRRAWQRGI